MKLCLRRPIAVAASLTMVVCLGCSSSPTDHSDAAADASATVDVAIEASTTQCTTPAPASKCTPANAGGVIRGVLTFDASHFSTAENVNLGIFLNHQWVMDSSEATQGGHPHAYKYVKGVDVTTGQLPFDIDLCELGPAMYSEENCGFNLVVMLDASGKNDPDKYGAAALTPIKGQLVKMATLDVSCRGDSQCLAMTADCADGPACTTYKPLAMSACICAANACPSQSVVCTHGEAGASDSGGD